MKYTKEFNSLPESEQIKKLKRVIEWWDDFGDCVQGDHRTYESACEYADEQELERYGPDHSGNYSSIHDFINNADLEDEADELFGEGWEAENDVEQIQALVGDDYIVKVIEPTSKRAKRADDYIQVIKK